jgi:hypothetical protein
VPAEGSGLCDGYAVVVVVGEPDGKRMRQKERQDGRRRRTMSLASITTTDYDMAWALTWRVLCEEGPWAQEKMRYALPCASDDRFAPKLPDHVRLFCLASLWQKNRPGTSARRSNCYIAIASALFVERCLVRNSHGSHMRCLHRDLKRNGLCYY